ncbi:M20/M25/M40 family metallo-hydrolase [Polyangium spumosum]|uniref:M20/M25/M40 family metallo-hydrolase n=2 Tax=Polyangium spumosum TaxID=889282 RepID=A0A6N7PEG8_9BACT|nr:M20/M25/M40 family metallo-hydrolase [Polyangium spumosum]
MGAMDPAALLAELIRHRTDNPGGDEPSICRMLSRSLAALGADEVAVVEVPRDEGTGAYVVARWGEPHTIINAHVDTVPANSGWTVPPWEGVITEDRVIGLGAADTKGAIAATLVALEGQKPRNVGVVFSGDEERTGTCIKHFLSSSWAQVIKRAVVCEPTGRAVGVRHRGCVAMSAEVKGRGGHSSGADQMPKPIVTMARLALGLDEIGRRWLDRGPADMKGLCLNVASIEGGVAFNVVPNRAALTFSVRPPPGFDVATFEAELEASARAAGEGIETQTVLSMSPFETRDVAPFRALLGSLPRAEATLPFWTEAALFSAAGIDAVVIGPGDITQAHAPDEYVTKSDLQWAVEVFRQVITRASGSAG